MTEPAAISQFFAASIPAGDWSREIDELCARLQKEYGVTARVGMELEFKCNSKASTAYSELRKQEFIAGLEKKLKDAKDAAEAASLADKIRQLHEFSAAEVMMYDLIEFDPATKDILQPLFGKSYSGNGYYDAPDMLELKLRHVAPRQACENQAILLRQLRQKTEEYGLRQWPHPSMDFPWHHVSFSFWKNGKNLMDVGSPPRSSEVRVAGNSTHMSLGACITEGVARAFYEGYLLQGMPRNRPVEFISAKPSRQSLLRIAKERLEVRGNDSNEQHHPGAMTTLALAGALHGLKKKSEEELSQLMPASPAVKPVFSAPPGFKQVIHFLNTLRFVDGELKMDEWRLERDAEAIAAECKNGGVGIPREEDFRKIRLIGTRIVFPPELDGLLRKITYQGAVRTFEVIPGYATGRLSSGRLCAYNLVHSGILQDALSPEFLTMLRGRAIRAYGEPAEEEQRDAEMERMAIAGRVKATRQTIEALSEGRNK